MMVCPAGSDGAKQQRPQVTDAEEKKSQMSADSGLSVTSGSQVCLWSIDVLPSGEFCFCSVG